MYLTSIQPARSRRASTPARAAQAEPRGQATGHHSCARASRVSGRSPRINTRTQVLEFASRSSTKRCTVDRMLAVCALASSAALLPDAPRTGRRAVLRGAASAAMLPSIAWAQSGVPEGMKTSESYAAVPATPCRHPRHDRAEQQLSCVAISPRLDAAPASFRVQVHQPAADLSRDDGHARRRHHELALAPGHRHRAARGSDRVRQEEGRRDHLGRARPGRRRGGDGDLRGGAGVRAQAWHALRPTLGLGFAHHNPGPHPHQVRPQPRHVLRRRGPLEEPGRLLLAGGHSRCSHPIVGVATP